MKVLLNSFHLNGHTLGFHPQTEKLQSHLLTQGFTLRVKPDRNGKSTTRLKTKQAIIRTKLKLIEVIVKF